MKLLILAAAAACFSGGASAQMFTGDTKLACEAVLCLSSGVRPGECQPSLSRYFGIHRRKLRDTFRARLDFLNLCPVAQQTPEMRSLVAAMSQGAGRCDAPYLNATLSYGGGMDGGPVYIGNTMPPYCQALYGHAYSGYQSTSTLPVYVGMPERGGYWVEAWDYERALAEYNARIAAEDAANSGNGWWWR
jgi:hypothetical protein